MCWWTITGSSLQDGMEMRHTKLLETRAADTRATGNNSEVTKSWLGC